MTAGSLPSPDLEPEVMRTRPSSRTASHRRLQPAPGSVAAACVLVRRNRGLLCSLGLLGLALLATGRLATGQSGVVVPADSH
jgi:hypothetical protein